MDWQKETQNINEGDRKKTLADIVHLQSLSKSQLRLIKKKKEGPNRNLGNWDI